MVQGILLLDKPKDCTSFSLVKQLRKVTNVQKIGHAGTLDPLATGVMVMLIGSKYTRQSNQFLENDKQYFVEITLGEDRSTYDAEGEVTATSAFIPSLEEVEHAIGQFQGTCTQIPPMYSAKKVDGKKLCDLARKGVEVERKSQQVELTTKLISYDYPLLKLEITCSKGTYVRTIAHDLGKLLKSYGYVSALRRLRSGSFSIDQCHQLDDILNSEDYLQKALIQKG